MQKKFKLSDVILSVICVVFVAEATAPVAVLGNSQFFWRLFMIAAFLVPYGLIASELGTAYPGSGGLYDWISLAFPGTRWGARAAWWYWLNFPLWMASLAVMVPYLLTIAFGVELGIWAGLAIELVFILIVTVIACYPVCDSVIILNLCAVIKVGLALLVGCMGIFSIARNGFVNDMSFSTFLPSFNLDSLSSISVIIFTMLGFEVVCTFSGDMDNPRRQIPQAIVIGGLVIAGVYLFGGFGIGAVIPASEVDAASGLIEAVILMSGRDSGLFIAAVTLLFLITLFGNMISWSLGINNTACHAAEQGDMPALFARRWVKNDMPIGAAMLNGIVAAVICVLGVLMTLIAPDSELFWTFFALNLVLLLMSYLPIFPAFLKLRRTDPDAERPFRVSGSPAILRVLAYVPMALIGISILFCAVPLSLDAQTLASVLPITVGTVICVLFGEVLTILREAKRNRLIPEEKLRARMREIISDPAHPVLAAAVGVVRDGTVLFSDAVGSRQPGGDAATGDTKYRIASISKLVTALGVWQLIEQSLIDPDADVSQYLGFQLRNPTYPHTPITVKMLLSHTSSIRDGGKPGSYNIPFGHPVSEFFTEGKPYYNPNCWAPPAEAPGEFFAYCNMNYCLLGTIIEQVSGERFDRYMRDHVFSPMGLTCSYNVSDMPEAAQAQVGTLCRKLNEAGESDPVNGIWVPQCDDFTNGYPSEAYAGYMIGTNGSLFGPMGSLRISVNELCQIMLMLCNGGSCHGVQILKPETIEKMFTPVWTYDPALKNGDNYHGLMNCYGMGPHIFTPTGTGDRIVPGQHLPFAGHTAAAYGLLGGMVFDRRRGNGIVYYLAGTGCDANDFPGEYSAFYRWEEALLTAAADFARFDYNAY